MEKSAVCRAATVEGTPQAHDEERNEEGGQSIALDLLEFETPNDCTDAQCLHDD